MSDLTTSYDIVYKDSFKGLRGQIEMACWVVARDKTAAGVEGSERDIAYRTLLGMNSVVDVAVHTVATDMGFQQKIIDSGYEIDDASLKAFLSDNWSQMAGTVTGA